MDKLRGLHLLEQRLPSVRGPFAAGPSPGGQSREWQAGSQGSGSRQSSKNTPVGHLQMGGGRLGRGGRGTERFSTCWSPWGPPTSREAEGRQKPGQGRGPLTEACTSEWEQRGARGSAGTPRSGGVFLTDARVTRGLGLQGNSTRGIGPGPRPPGEPQPAEAGLSRGFNPE